MGNTTNMEMFELRNDMRTRLGKFPMDDDSVIMREQIKQQQDSYGSDDVIPFDELIVDINEPIGGTVVKKPIGVKRKMFDIYDGDAFLQELQRRARENGEM